MRQAGSCAAVACLQLVHRTGDTGASVAAITAAVFAAGQQRIARLAAAERFRAGAAANLALRVLAVALSRDHDGTWWAGAGVAELVAAVLARPPLGAAAAAAADVTTGMRRGTSGIPHRGAQLAAEAAVGLGDGGHHALAAGAAPLVVAVALVALGARMGPAADARQVKNGIALCAAPNLCMRGTSAVRMSSSQVLRPKRMDSFSTDRQRHTLRIVDKAFIRIHACTRTHNAQHTQYTPALRRTPS